MDLCQLYLIVVTAVLSSLILLSIIVHIAMSPLPCWEWRWLLWRSRTVWQILLVKALRISQHCYCVLVLVVPSMYAHTYVHTCDMHVHMCPACVHLCMYVCMYVHIYVCTMPVIVTYKRTYVPWDLALFVHNPWLTAIVCISTPVRQHQEEVAEKQRRIKQLANEQRRCRISDTYRIHTHTYCMCTYIRTYVPCTE